ncbi:MAG: virulence RhuM family protein [Flavobacteriales bacterium]|nr:virulence RhuM family protein [Flavobacteriales bacterium]
MRHLFHRHRPRRHSGDHTLNPLRTSVQNKFHWAIYGRTAAEVVMEPSRCQQAEHGADELAHFSDPQEDAVVAKDYLGEQSLDHLNRIVNQEVESSPSYSATAKPMHGGLEEEAARLPHAERAGDPASRWQREPRGGRRHTP